MDTLPPDTCYFAATRQVARVMTRIYDKHLAPAGVTIAQFSLLRTIGRAGSITAAELADNQAMDRTTLVRALKPLQRDGLVTDRRLSPKGRQLGYSLSELGAARVAAAKPLWIEAQREIEVQIGKGAIERMRHDMQDLTASLTSTNS
ncbi:MAG TPA: MarR family winged helix-turn-helix transcriptional regulator [Devosiaceae bacterium]|jgi:DNA-binding MarR family transcriptional regulator